MKENFDASFTSMLRSEGFGARKDNPYGFSNHPRDPGGATQLGVVNLEAQRMDKVQYAACHGAHAAHIASIWRDLRAEQDEMERRLHFRLLIAREISRLASRSLMS